MYNNSFVDGVKCILVKVLTGVILVKVLTEASSTMRALASARCTGARLYT